MTTANRLRESGIVNEWDLCDRGEAIVYWRASFSVYPYGWTVSVKGRRFKHGDAGGALVIGGKVDDPSGAIKIAARATGCVRWCRSPFSRHHWIPAVALERRGITPKTVVEVEAT